MEINKKLPSITQTNIQPTEQAKKRKTPPQYLFIPKQKKRNTNIQKHSQQSSSELPHQIVHDTCTNPSLKYFATPQNNMNNHTETPNNNYQNIQQETNTLKQPSQALQNTLSQESHTQDQPQKTLNISSSTLQYNNLTSFHQLGTQHLGVFVNNWQYIYPAISQLPQQPPQHEYMYKTITKASNFINNGNLCNYNFTGAYCNDVSFSGANLHNSNFNQTILNLCYFNGTNLAGVTFINAKMTNTQFENWNNKEVNLINSSFSGATLNNVTFKNLKSMDVQNIKSLDFTRTKLTAVYFINARSKYSQSIRGDFSNSILQRVSFNGVTLNDPNFTNSILINIEFKRVRLINPVFHQAQIIGSSLTGTCLKGIDLSQADLTHINILGVNFTGSILNTDQNINISNTLTYLCNHTHTDFNMNDFLDLYFNHMANPETGSVLTAIDTIDSRYHNLKIKLMAEVIQWLLNNPNVNFTRIAESLIDILLEKDSIYIKHPMLKKFVHEKLIPLIIEKANCFAINFSHNMANFLLDTIIDCSTDEQKQFMLNNNGCFIQLIYNCRKSKQVDLEQKSKFIYTTYLNNTIAGKIDKIVDCDTENELILLYQNNTNPDGLSSLTKQIVSAILVPMDYLSFFLYNLITDNHIERNIYCYWTSKDGVQLETHYNPILDELFQKFKIFSANYIFQQKNAEFSKLIDLLNIGVDWHQHFIKATLVKSYVGLKLVSEIPEENFAIQSKLANIFNPFLTKAEKREDIYINQNHLNQILSCYYLIGSDRKMQSQALILIGGLFAKYSSSYTFGVEGNSPEILRLYAYAIINTAIKLDPKIIPYDEFNDWKNRLLGLNGRFECTAVLQNNIFQFCMQHFPEIAKILTPPSWM